MAPRGPAEHGTPSGYNRHRRLHEEACGPCRQCNMDWRRAKRLRVASGYRLTMQEALAELGLPPDRIPGREAP